MGLEMAFQEGLDHARTQWSEPILNIFFSLYVPGLDIL